MSAATTEVPYCLTIEDLLTYGFRETKNNLESQHDREFWWTLRDDVGKKWCVRVRFWQFSKYSRPGYVVEDGFDLELHLRFAVTRPNTDGEYCHISRCVRNTSPAEIIAWCAATADKMGAIYNDYWE